MDRQRARSPRPLPPLPSKPTAPLPPPPPQLSAATSPSSHDFFFAFSSASSSPVGGHLHPLSSMSRGPVGRVGSDLSHNSYSKASSRHPTTSCGTGGKDDRDRAKNRTPPLSSALGAGAWRKESRSSGGTTGGRKPAEEKRKDRARGALDVGQWVKKYITAMVAQLRSSFYRQAEREQRPHSFSGHDPNAAREMKERERWMRRRGQLSSAPASLRASPANSGHLSVGGSVKLSTSSEESTMEELQSAIEAAIAHCKSSMSRAYQAAGGETGQIGFGRA